MSCFDIYLKLGLPYSSNSKEFACNTGDLGQEDSGEGNGNQIQYSFFLFSFIYFSIEA